MSHILALKKSLFLARTTWNKGRGRQVFDALIDNLADWIHDPRLLGIELAGDAG